MKTSIDNNLCVYQVITSTGKQAFCNIEQLNEVVKFYDCRSGYFKIYEYWNNRPQLLSIKNLDAKFEGSQLKREFSYTSR